MKRVIALMLVLMVLVVPSYGAAKKRAPAKKAPAKRVEVVPVSRDNEPQAQTPKMSDEEFYKLWNNASDFSTDNPYGNSDAWSLYNYTPTF